MWVGVLGSFRPLNHNLKQLCNYLEFFCVCFFFFNPPSNSNLEFQTPVVCYNCWDQGRVGEGVTEEKCSAGKECERGLLVPWGHYMPGPGERKASLTFKHEVVCARRWSPAESRLCRLVFNSLKKQTCLWHIILANSF